MFMNDYDYVIEKQRINKTLDHTVEHLKSNKLIKNLTIVTHGYHNDQIDKISTILQFNRCIDNLCIVFDIGQDITNILKLVDTNILLLTVVFPNMSDILVTSLAQILSDKPVKKLRVDTQNLSNNQLNIFTNIISNNRSLTHLSIKSCKENIVNINHIVDLVNNSNIESIELVDLSIDENHINENLFLKLKSLTFDDVHISYQGCKTIADNLNLKTSLQCLGFNSNNIDNESIDYIISGLQSTSNLKNIMITNNNITDDKIIDLICAIKENINICSILLGSLHNTSQYFKAVADLITCNSSIQLVELYVNSVDLDNYKYLEDAITQLHILGTFNIKSFIINLPNNKQYQHSEVVNSIFNSSIVPQLTFDF